SGVRARSTTRACAAESSHAPACTTSWRCDPYQGFSICLESERTDVCVFRFVSSHPSTTGTRMIKTSHCGRYGVNIPLRMLGVVLCLSGLCSVAAARPRERLPVRLDPRGPYLILKTLNAARAYGDAVAKAKALHPAAAEASF